jgi:hypothetical protein
MNEGQTERVQPPPIASQRGWPTGLVLGLALLTAAGLALLFLFDPARHAFYPVCLFKKMTGYDCPGCGGLRALHQLLRGEVWCAFQLNAMVVVALPLLGAWAVQAWATGSRGSCRKAPVWIAAWVALAVVVGFGVLRNLPLWPFGVTPM